MDIKIVVCNRCNHKWATRIKPIQCPNCKSVRWNKPRVRETKKISKFWNVKAPRKTQTKDVIK